MIAAWMLFAIEISALLFAAAWIAERAVLAARRPVRGVWLVAIVGANFLPILFSQIPIGAEFAQQWSVMIAPESVLAKIGTPLVVLWALGVAVGLFVCIAAVWRMARTRPSWKNEHVNETPVLVSHDIGPALVGVLHYSIVVPQWAYSLEERARTLLLTHEREHARHYDPLLLATAVLAVVVAPWNVFNWFFLKRLHLAVELDCDQRVLRAHPDAHDYGALLLDVAERVLPSVMPAAAFVEHGSSLETRLKAMTVSRKSYQSLRIGAGVAASALLIATACVVPRPMVIFIQPVAAPFPPVAQLPSDTAPKLATIWLTTAPVTAERPTTIRSGASVFSSSVLPVAPSKYVQSLDSAELERMRSAVVATSPRTLGNWPRRDSALVLLFNARGDVVKSATVRKAQWRVADVSRAMLGEAFMVPEIAALESSAEFQIAQGARGERLTDPLMLITGQMAKGADTPLARAEVTPSQKTIVTILRERHPELLQDTSGSGKVGALLYGTKGQLLMSAAVQVEASQILADGSTNPAYEKEIVRKAFGAVMDSGVVVQSGSTSFSGDPDFRQGPARTFYAVLAKNSEFFDKLRAMQSKGIPGPMTGTSSRTSGIGDGGVMERRLLGLVDTRVPDAFGAWSRGDSAVVFLFDADDQLIARVAAPIAANWQLQTLAQLINHGVPGVASDDVEQVGGAILTSSAKGRRLDKPLNVYWGRLGRGVVFPFNKR
ncbi:MAG: M56 family metallopeptidase [Gemmatimonas sp.]